ncbi:MAG: polyprenyl diphosphate synthase [Elusimicrobiaceae bacterium]|nr:polyprenyl diphosphate synthase [Elusimicrobiaceae bacterium]
MSGFIPPPPDSAPLPAHIAIVMDGNGRWAKARGLSRLEGHREGVESVEAIIKACCDLGIKVLTLYTFSTENWSRPRYEVSALMRLLCSTLRAKHGLLMNYNVRLKISGRREGVGKTVLEELDEEARLLSANTGMILNLAFNYGGRQELTDAVNRLLAAGRTGVTQQDIADALYTAGLPDPDLVIRTSGERRISNFLLWQAAYAEYYFTDVFWPDFRAPQLNAALADYRKRERRFGGIK